MMLQDQKVSGFDAWSIYTAIKLHFGTSGYDAFKFNFKGPRLKHSSFENRRDRYFFEKLTRRYSKKKNLIEYFLANTLADSEWIGSMTDENYEIWQAKIQGLDYRFRQDMSLCASRVQDFNKLFECEDKAPPLYSYYIANEISLETLCILDILCSYSKQINTKVNDPLGLLTAVTHKINRYCPFILNMSLQKKPFRDAVIKTFTIS